MQKNLVSILTPMYNTGRYVHCLLDSVLEQTYPHIEMIVIDDGSTDNSKTVVESYRDMFEQKGYTLHYIYQENAGQSMAIKNGLQLIRGEFLVWPDSDDYYASNVAIEKMVNVLQTSSDEFQMVRTQVYNLDEDSLLPLCIMGLSSREEEPNSLFHDCLFSKHGFYFCSGAYMVRTMILREATDFDIYTSKDAGQNWQLLLPILFEYRCKTIKEPLYNVVIRKTSHSRGQFVGYEGTKRKYDAYLNTQIETLKRIKGFPKAEINEYYIRLSESYNKKLFKIALKANNRQGALDQVRKIRNKLSYKRKILYSLLYLRGGTYMINAILLSQRRVNNV